MISNMYPSTKYPNYGIFVKNFVDELSHIKKVKRISLTKTENKYVKLLNYFFFYFNVWSHYVFGGYEAIYVHYAGYNCPPIILGRLFNKKTRLLVNVHGSDVTPEKKLEEKTNFLTGILVNKADLTIVPSEYFREIVVEKYGEVPIYVSASAGVNLQLFNNEKKVVSKRTSFTIGYVGRIDEEKGWDILLMAFQKLVKVIPDARLIMVGSGAQEESANELIYHLGLTNFVERRQMLTQNELVEVYSSLDAFIFPSFRKGESLGLVGLEAMACGVPVIGSDFGGIKTYVQPGVNGFLFEPKDSDALERTMRAYYYLPESRKIELAKQALLTAKMYDSKVINAQLIKKIEACIEGA
ncbi:glycosyltransferase family 4 protein [Enterococcus sp. AZ194]|uniref:glycosyltransferase family 4 protein n=1 Tax=Enterococcus sp. AZ194 TaxID=2774629 RepID=UPI003F683679